MQEFLLTLRMKLKEQMYTLRPEDNRCIYFKVTPVRSDLQVNILRILGECLMISSLPGKAMRTLVDIARLAEQFILRSQSRAW